DLCCSCRAQAATLEPPPPPPVDSTGFIRSLALPACPECLRLLNELCRVNFELGKADGRHCMLRVAARSLLEWADAAGPMPALAVCLAALQEALEAIERADPTAELPPRP